jgi:hypothetical protein
VEDELLVEAKHGWLHANLFGLLHLVQQFLRVGKKEDPYPSVFIVGALHGLWGLRIERDLRVATASLAEEWIAAFGQMQEAVEVSLLAAEAKLGGIIH